MKDNIKPRGKYILIRVTEKENDSVIYKPDTVATEEKDQVATIIKLGDKLADSDLKVGDKVVVNGMRFSGVAVDTSNKKDMLFLIKEKDVLAIREN